MNVRRLSVNNALIVTDEDLRGQNVLHSIYFCYVIAQEFAQSYYECGCEEIVWTGFTI